MVPVILLIVDQAMLAGRWMCSRGGHLVDGSVWTHAMVFFNVMRQMLDVVGEFIIRVSNITSAHCCT